MKFRTFLLAASFSVCLCAFAGEPLTTKPVESWDLGREGLPVDYFRNTDFKHCPYQFLGYRTVLWLNANRILVGFNSTPTCSKTSQLIKGILKLVLFDRQGTVVARAELPYDAGDGNAIRIGKDGDIWVGPDDRIIVQIYGTHLKVQPDSRDKLIILSAMLRPLQEIDTDWKETYSDRITFKRVSQSGDALIFEKGSASRNNRICVSYTGTPLSISATHPCSLLDEIDMEHAEERKLLPTSMELAAIAGYSADRARVAIFATKSNSLCEGFGKFCSSDGTFYIFDRPSHRIILQKPFPKSGRAALSPDGKYFASFTANGLDLYRID